jgi:hypothetical protein
VVVHAKGVIVASLIAALGACSDRTRAPDPVLRGQLAECAQALEGSVMARGAGKLRALIAGCRHACPGLSDEDPSAAEPQVTELFERCGLFCTSEARHAWESAAPPARFAALIDHCGPESYALTAASAPLLSPDWAILLRVHEWLERHREHADPDTRAALDRAGMHAHFRLALPARLKGVYALPDARAGRPVETAFYVIVEAGQGADSPRLRGGAIPVARVRPGDLERRPVPGGEFPGRPLASPASDYADLVRLFEGMHPGSHASIATAPLLLTDQGAPVSALIQATVALGTPRFSAGVSGHVALAHPVELEHLTTTGSAAPVLRAAADTFTVIGGDQDITLAGHERERLATALAELSVQRAPQDKIEVDLPAGATVAELVRILDIIAESKFRVALLRVAAAATP